MPAAPRPTRGRRNVPVAAVGLVYSLKVAVAWVAAGLATIGNVEVFGDQPIGWIGALITAALTFVVLYRTNANRELKTLVETRGDRIADLTDERDRFRDESKEQRELKHAALNELLAEKKLRDFTPLLEALVELQKGQSRRSEVEASMTEALDRIAQTQEAQTPVLEAILGELKELRMNGGRK